jgi:hypothetical protein
MNAMMLYQSPAPAPALAPVSIPLGLQVYDATVRICQVEVARDGGRPLVHFGSIQPLNVAGVGFLVIRNGLKEIIINLNQVLSIRPLERPCLMQAPQPLIEGIQRLVADYFGIPLETFLSRARPERIASPRQIAMYLCRLGEVITLEEIGRGFRRDHGTILHACRAVVDRMSHDLPFRHIVHTLQTMTPLRKREANQLQLPLLTSAESTLSAIQTTKGGA